MSFKPVVVCLYLALFYWLSSLHPMFKMLFFPTLAAIAFFFMSRITHIKELFTISTAAFIASIIGSVCFFFNSGVLSFLLACMITISLKLFFKIAAPPVLAVAVIPFFAHPAAVWLFPLSICFTLSGLILVLWSIQKLETRLAQWFPVGAKKNAEELSS